LLELFTDFKKRLKDIKREGSFLQNLAYTISGSAYGILLQLIFSPILARIYTPDAYGNFGVYMAIVSNISMVSMLMLPNAFVIPKKEKEFASLLQLTSFLAISTSVLTFLIFSLFGNQIASFFNHDGPQWWYYLIGPSLFLVNFKQINSNWIIRLKLFKKSVKVGFVTSLLGRLFNLIYGLLSRGAIAGLILGEITGKTIGLFVQIKIILSGNYHILLKGFSFKKIWNALSQYRNYPLFLLPGNYLNLLAGQLPIFLFSSAFGFQMVGFYTFSLALLDMPLRLIGNSISPVFLQKAAEVQNNQPEKLGAITKEAFQKLLFVALIPFGLISAFGDYLFLLVFGENWEMAGTFCRILSVFYMFRLSVSPISSVLAIIRKEKYNLFNSGVIFTLRVISLLVGVYLIQDIIIALLLFSLSGVIAIFVLIYIIFKFLKQNPFKIIFQSTLYVIISLGAFNLLRVLFDVFFV